MQYSVGLKIKGAIMNLRLFFLTLTVLCASTPILTMNRTARPAIRHHIRTTNQRNIVVRPHTGVSSRSSALKQQPQRVKTIPPALKSSPGPKHSAPISTVSQPKRAIKIPSSPTNRKTGIAASPVRPLASSRKAIRNRTVAQKRLIIPRKSQPLKRNVHASRQVKPRTLVDPTNNRYSYTRPEPDRSQILNVGQANNTLNEDKAVAQAINASLTSTHAPELHTLEVALKLQKEQLAFFASQKLAQHTYVPTKSPLPAHKDNHALQTPPAPMKALVTQLQAVQQSGASCGYHAVFNAKAMQTLINQGKKITSQAVQVIVTSYQPHIGTNELTTDYIIYLADQYHIKNLYCIQFQSGRLFKPIGSSQIAEEIDQALIKFRTLEDPQSCFFIVNTGGHWILTAAIKNSDQSIEIFYLDSQNVPSLNRAQELGRYIVDLINGTLTLQDITR